jgi:hypothetical protein
MATNVLLILADDMNYNTIGCFGCPVDNISPNLERFDIVLHWPPLSGFFLVYDKKRMDFIVPLWGKPVETYNAGDISV